MNWWCRIGIHDWDDGIIARSCKRCHEAQGWPWWTDDLLIVVAVALWVAFLGTLFVIYVYL